jgi:2-polyprenyl-3-methyl-5-hydroxy-6-metoxy-1,4-benzoquinol methylase
MQPEQAWDQVYATKAMAAYPDNALIRFVAKHYYGVPDRSAVRFLDVGCGAGASTWYLAREGFSVWAVDLSATAIARLSQRLATERVYAHLAVGDIGSLTAHGNADFDCVVDVSSLCYVPADEIADVMARLHSALKPGGRMFSITPSKRCARGPFEAFADDVALTARFMTDDEVGACFARFSRISITGYDYTVADGSLVRLWAVEAEK